MGQANASDVFHNQEVQPAGLVGVVGGYDIRVSQSRPCHFAVKAVHGLGAFQQPATDYLEGYRTAHAQVRGLVNDAHAASTEESFDAIAGVVGQLHGDARIERWHGLRGSRHGRGGASGAQQGDEGIARLAFQGLTTGSARGQMALNSVDSSGSRRPRPKSVRRSGVGW